jgi:mitochondrial fission protein ELM1
MSDILIVSDGRPGHLNQSIALAKYLGYPYEIVEVLPKYRWSKALSYVLDRAGIETTRIYQPIVLKSDKYRYVIGAGSGTYYMTKTVAHRVGAKSIAMMLPKGYRYDYDLIFAQAHDDLPAADNIIQLPANFAYVEPQGLYQAKKRSVGVIIGGNNSLFTMKAKHLKAQLDVIFDRFRGYEIAVTTSPRTPADVEEMIEAYGFDYQVIFSKNPINPIADFLDQCETVCITGDSTSMISEAISFGSANVVVLPLHVNKPNKFTRFVAGLEEEGYVHLFDGTIKDANRKIDFSQYAQRVLA